MQEPLRFFFKLLSQSKVATLASGGITETRHDSADASSPKLSHSKLLYVADKGHKCRYLIDTGAAISVFCRNIALTGFRTLTVSPWWQLITVLYTLTAPVNASSMSA